MAVPSSGQLRLRGDIALEVDGSATGLNVSLGALSSSAGFSIPDTMSEFYGYSSAIAPSVTTNSITNNNLTSFIANGNVTSDGDATITERGFYVGTNSASPTNNTKYTVGGTTGAFSRTISGLSSATTYYAWAYATNSVGTTYGGRASGATLTPYSPSYVTQIQNSSKTSGCTDYYNSYPAYKRFYQYYRDPQTGGYVNIGQYLYESGGSTHYVDLNEYTPVNGKPSSGVYANNTVNRFLVQHGSGNSDLYYYDQVNVSHSSDYGANIYSSASAYSTPGAITLSSNQPSYQRYDYQARTYTGNFMQIDVYFTVTI